MAYYRNQYQPRYPRPQANRSPAPTGPRQIVAKFPSRCATCQGAIAVGDAILWAPGVPAVHVECPADAYQRASYEAEVALDASLPAQEVRLAPAASAPAKCAHCLVRPLLAGRTHCGHRFCHEADDWARHSEAEAKKAHEAKDVFSALRGRLEVEDAGVYKLPDGAIVKVQANREKTKVYAKRLVEHKGIERATEGEAGERVHAEYVYEAGLIAQVSREGVKLSLEEAKTLTIRYGFCIRCGRHLVAAQSVEQGMGPVCITYFS